MHNCKADTVWWINHMEYCCIGTFWVLWSNNVRTDSKAVRKRFHSVQTMHAAHVHVPIIPNKIWFRSMHFITIYCALVSSNCISKQGYSIECNFNARIIHIHLYHTNYAHTVHTTKEKTPQDPFGLCMFAYELLNTNTRFSVGDNDRARNSSDFR